MATITKLLTAEEYWESHNSRWSELVDGVVIEMSPPGGEHGREQAKVTRVLFRAEDDGVGYVLGEIGFVIRRNPDAVRAPDIAFVRKERVPSTGIPKAFWQGAPDLAVEVVSPYDRPGEIQTKIREWIEGGDAVPGFSCQVSELFD